jgi:hypothetical protein
MRRDAFHIGGNDRLGRDVRALGVHAELHEDLGDVVLDHFSAHARRR